MSIFDLFSKNKIDNLNIKGHASRQELNFINATGQNKMLPVANGYYYQTGIVLDVIQSPKEYFSSSSNRQKIDSIMSEDDRSFNFIEKIPKNSVLCQVIDKGKNKYKNPSICFPFFPSHLSLPIKPGEHIWIMTEVIGDVERHYWVARKHAAFHVENLNYTHQERELDIYDNDIIKNTGKTEKASLARNKYLDFRQVAESGKMSLDPFDIQKSSGYQQLTVEPVPDIVKKPGDLILQGSNNALMHITQEKFTKKSTQRENYPANTFSGNDLPASAPATPFSPAIDICVARKKKSLLEVKERIANLQQEENFIEATSGLGFIKNVNADLNLQTYEINKMAFIEEAKAEREILSLINDYDIDIKNCGARVYLSNNCDIDNVFNIGQVKPPEGEQSDQEKFKRVGPGSVFAGYGENIRLVSDGTFRVVNNFIDETSGNEKSGSTYIEIDKEGKVSIGSIDKNFSSAGGENINKGMQPFVKGNELQDLLERLIIEIQGIVNILDTNFQNNTTPGFGSPNLSLILAGLELTTIPGGSGQAPYDELETIKNELDKFKSTLIQGE